jgi:deoxycytidylate deaminase
MKPLHVQIRIEQCLALAKASHCPRRKLAALLLDPKRNVVLADGYNGGPRGGEGTLCRGHWCERDGLKVEDFEVEEGSRHDYLGQTGSRQIPVVHIRVKATGAVIKSFDKDLLDGVNLGPLEVDGKTTEPHQWPTTMEKAKAWLNELVAKNPPIKSGTMMERGCHHAEMNVVCNAAASTVSCTGAWLIVLAEPCMMCAKMIHHAGIKKVILVDGGYAGGKDGVEYLRANGVEVEEVAGPKDPRLTDG